MNYPNYRNLIDYANDVAKANDKWWRDPATGKPVERNMGEMLMLVVSEIAEAMEGDRKHLSDDKLPEYAMLDVELVDALIRIFDILGHRHVDVERIYQDKMQYNAARQDHTNEARLTAHGKRY